LSITIWDTARSLGYADQFKSRPEGVGGDDHEPFLRAGIESVDLIQLGSYPYWHKPDDTLDKVSPQSFEDRRRCRTCKACRKYLREVAGTERQQATTIRSAVRARSERSRISLGRPYRNAVVER